jgi:hypothetical protein
LRSSSTCCGLWLDPRLPEVFNCVYSVGVHVLPYEVIASIKKHFGEYLNYPLGSHTRKHLSAFLISHR